MPDRDAVLRGLLLNAGMRLAHRQHGWVNRTGMSLTRHELSTKFMNNTTHIMLRCVMSIGDRRDAEPDVANLILIEFAGSGRPVHGGRRPPSYRFLAVTSRQWESFPVLPPAGVVPAARGRPWEMTVSIADILITIRGFIIKLLHRTGRFFLWSRRH